MSTDSNSDRRTWMKRALKAGAVGYAAPMIVGSVARVSAAPGVSTPCTAIWTNNDPCPQSEPPLNCSFGLNTSCLCAPEAGTSNTRCVQLPPGPPPSCVTSATCPGNWICMGGCLVCFPLCSVLF